MKILDRKGQGAMEYLMTYGWAILVVMIVGVVLWQLGIFGGGPGAANTARGFGRIKVMDPSIKYVQDGTLTFTIMNGAGQTVSDLVMGVPSPCTAGAINSDMSAGGTQAVTLSSCGAKGIGDSFAVDIGFNYTMSVAGNTVTHQEKGTIRGAAE